MNSRTGELWMLLVQRLKAPADGETPTTQEILDQLVQESDPTPSTTKEVI